MIIVRCKECNTELRSSNKTQVCGCPNMMTVNEDKVSAVDLSKVVMINSGKEKKQNVLSQQDLLYQEQRRKRKVRRLDFDVKQGRVVEWFMALVLKTSEGASPPWVQIPPLPL